MYLEVLRSWEWLVISFPHSLECQLTKFAAKLEKPSGQNSLPLVTVQIAQTPEQWSFPHPLRQNDESKLSTQSSILNPNQYPLDHCPRESRTEQE